jgi:hypothetical protein
LSHQTRRLSSAQGHNCSECNSCTVQSPTAWSHRSSVAMRCDMMAMRRRLACVAMTSHIPELSAATRKARARCRPPSPIAGSSARGLNRVHIYFA